MEECPLIREFQANPMRAREFVDGHRRLPLLVRILFAAMLRPKK